MCKNNFSKFYFQLLQVKWLAVNITAWKVSKYGDFSGRYFLIFGLEKALHLDTFQIVYTFGVLTSFRINNCHCTKNEVFHWGFLQWMWPNPQVTADLVTFIEEILNGKLHFLCSVSISESSRYCHYLKKNNFWNYLIGK